MKFVIFAPGYTHVHAGVVALHRLCHLLNEAGYKAEIFTAGNVNPLWNTPLWTDLEDCVIVYPEIIPGNPLKAKHVVRWLLNSPGFFNVGDKEFPGEMVWAYHDYYGAGLTDRILYIPTINPKVFFKGEGKRDIYCTYIGKGKGEKIAGTVLITRTYPPEQIQTANLLRHCKILYTYDEHTSLIPEALICGAEVVVMGKDMPKVNIENYEQKYNDTAPAVFFAEEVKGYFGWK